MSREEFIDAVNASRELAAAFNLFGEVFERGEVLKRETLDEIERAVTEYIKTARLLCFKGESECPKSK